MPHRRDSQTFPDGFTPGDEISLDALEYRSIAMNSSGDAIFYLGYRREDQPHDIPYYAVSVAGREKKGRESRRFVRLTGGMITFDTLFSPHDAYRILEDRFVTLPSGADSYFGVLKSESRSEDEALTRQLFGATIEELRVVARVFGEITGRASHGYSDAGRVTFSRSRNNDCDLSGCLIPREFPYLAFEEAQYDWSHISLYGFYRLLAFLCSGRRESLVKLQLVEAGVERELLDQLIKCGQQFYGPIRA